MRRLAVVNQQLDAQADVVAMLEGFLALAKSGEVTAVAVATVRHDGSVSTGWAAGGSFHQLHAAAHVLAVRMAS